MGSQSGIEQRAGVADNGAGIEDGVVEETPLAYYVPELDPVERRVLPPQCSHVDLLQFALELPRTEAGERRSPALVVDRVRVVRLEYVALVVQDPPHLEKHVVLEVGQRFLALVPRTVPSAWNLLRDLVPRMTPLGPVQHPPVERSVLTQLRLIEHNLVLAIELRLPVDDLPCDVVAPLVVPVLRKH